MRSLAAALQLRQSSCPKPSSTCSSLILTWSCHLSSSATKSPSSSSSSTWTLPPGVISTTIRRELPLAFGGTLPSLTIAWKQWGHDGDGKPVVYIMPSMSHSAYVTSAADTGEPSASPSTTATSTARVRGWWEQVVGYGTKYGINLDRYRVICASPLGAPYGTSSPLTINEATGQPYRSSFPQITPADQARAHAYLMDYLGLRKVFAIVGAR
jgi:homoserine O-acetyltransferase